MRQDERSCERLMLGPGQDVLPNDELRGKVRDNGDRFAGPCNGTGQGFGKEFEASGCNPVCSRLQTQVRKERSASVRILSRGGERPTPEPDRRL